MTKVRQHRGSLADSMETVFEVENFDQLVDAINKSLAHYTAVSREEVHVTPYTYDCRIGWNTHLVELDGYGVWGMTDGPL